MADIAGGARSAWRSLEHAWAETRVTWRGITAERFQAQFWDDMDAETRSYLAELDRLEEELRQALAAAR